MPKSASSSGALRPYAKAVCLATYLLIFAGSLVTSTGSALAVPDWPLSYGMLFPPMVGGVLYEHGHRLFAATVGLLTVILVVWILRVEKRKSVRRLAWLAIAAILLQGSLGGITVLFLLPTAISMSHAILGQTFFLLTVFIAYVFSKENEARGGAGTDEPHQKKFLKWAVFFLAVVYAQLFLGALMRHTGSGLAIPDFPKMGNQWLPRFDKDMWGFINDYRFMKGWERVTRLQIFYHFLHRLGAVAVLLSALWLSWKGKALVKNQPRIITTIWLMDGCVIVQILLGALSIWTDKSPWITSVHVLLGAGILGLAALLVLRSKPV